MFAFSTVHQQAQNSQNCSYDRKKATGKTGESLMSKWAVSDFPMNPTVSFGYTVRVWSPSANPAKVVFPPIVTFPCPSKL